VGDLGATGAEDDFDDIEADGNQGIAEKTEPGVGAANEGLLFRGVDGIGRTAKAAESAGLYLDEDEGFLFAADDVDLAAVLGTEVAEEDLEAVTPEMAGGELLPLAAEAQVLGFSRRGRGGTGGPGEKFCDEWGKGHGF